MAKFEVPQNLWESVMGSIPSKWKGKRNSVEFLNDDEAVDFCTKVTGLLRAAKLIDAARAKLRVTSSDGRSRAKMSLDD